MMQRLFNVLAIVSLLVIGGCTNKQVSETTQKKQPPKEEKPQIKEVVEVLTNDEKILLPPKGQKYFGAFVTMRENQAKKKFTEFAEKAGKAPAIQMIFMPWPKNMKADFPLTFAKNAYEMGAVPMLTWEPWWAYSKASYPMHSDIAAGKYDEFLINFFKQAGSLNQPYFLRFGHEVEGAHYPWSERFDKKQSAENYIKAFRHVANVARKYAPKSIIVWSPAGGGHNADKYYPGDKFVDWIGASVYNFAKWPQDPTFQDVMGSWIKIVRKHNKPAIICEMGSAEKFKPGKDWDPNGDGDYSDHKGWVFPEMGDKSQWLNRFFDVIENDYPEVLGCVWFHINKEADWRINSSEKSLKTFRKRIGSNCYISAKK